MGWRLYSRDAHGNEEVAFATTRRDCIARAREFLAQSRTIMRLESDDCEILEGKQLQEALALRRDPGTMH